MYMYLCVWCTLKVYVTVLRVYVQVRVSMLVCLCHVCWNVYVCVYVCVCVKKNMFERISTCLGVCVFRCMYVTVCSNVHVCVYVWTSDERKNFRLLPPNPPLPVTRRSPFRRFPRMPVPPLRCLTSYYRRLCSTHVRIALFQRILDSFLWP